MRRTAHLAAVLAAAAVLVLAGCGDDADDDAASTTTAPTTTEADAASTTTAPDTSADTTAPSGGSTGGSTGGGSTGAGSTGGGATSSPSPTGPVFASFSVDADACPNGPPPAPDVSVTSAPYDGKVRVSWKVTGPYDEIYVAVDNPDGPYASGLPSAGTQELTRQCTGSHTYYVVAVSGGKKTVKSQSVGAG